MILIILLIWSVTMVFHSVLCLDSDTATPNQTLSEEVAWANTIHAAFFLYLSLYGEYSFELNGKYDVCVTVNFFTLIKHMTSIRKNLTLKALNKNCSRRHFNFLLLSFKEYKA